MSDRKARLFACGVARLLLPFLADERSRRALEVAESHADGLATAADLADAEASAQQARRGAASRIVVAVADKHAWQAARLVVISAQLAEAYPEAADWSGRLVSRARQLLPCVFGEPCRPSHLPPACRVWNDAVAVRIAEAAYDERAFDRLPILGDALEEAGCTDPAILSHCRGPGPHVRGCWVVDLVLGRI